MTKGCASDVREGLGEPCVEGADELPLLQMALC